MKKLLALVLALVMTMSLVTISNAAYSDKADIDLKEAVDVLSAVGVFEGSDGKFDPKANLTREQAAKLVAYLQLGKKSADALVGGNKFTDVAANRWSAGYVDYCATTGIVAGVGNGQFAPAGSLTALQFGKMLLICLGYDAKAEGLTGSDWQINASKLMASANLLKGLDTVTANSVVTREQAAQMMLNALKAPMVTYDTKGSTITVDGTKINFGASVAKYETSTVAKDQNISKEKLTSGEYTVELGEKLYKDLKKNSTTDAFERPATEWKIKSTTVGTYADEADATYTAEVKFGTIYSDLGLSKGIAVADVKHYVDGTKQGAIPADIYKGNTTDSFGGNGVLTEVFYDADNNTAIVTEVNTYIGKIVASYAATSTKDAYVTIEAKTGGGANYTTDDTFANGDFVKYTYSNKTGDTGIKAMEVAEKVVGDLTAYTVGKSVNIGTTTYKANNVDGSKATIKSGLQNAMNTECTVYLDDYGYALWVDATAASDAYAVVIGTNAVAPGSGSGTLQYADKAELLLLDGTRKVVNVTDDTVLGAGAGQIAVNDIVTYKVNSKGNYKLTLAADTNSADLFNDTGSGSLNNSAAVKAVEKGNSKLAGDSAALKFGYNNAGTITQHTGAKLGANGKTVFLFWNPATKTVQRYVGIANVPTFTIAQDKDATYTAYSSSTGAPFYAKVFFGVLNTDATLSTTSKDVIFIKGSADEESHNDALNDYYTYDAIVNGEITKINTSHKVEKYTLATGLTKNSDDVYDTNTTTGLVLGTNGVDEDNDSATDLKYGTTGTDAAVNGTITLAGNVVSVADDCKVFRISHDQKEIFASSVASIQKDTNDLVWYKTTDGEVTTIVIQILDDAPGAIGGNATYAFGAVTASEANGVKVTLTDASFNTVPTTVSVKIYAKTFGGTEFNELGTQTYGDGTTDTNGMVTVDDAILAKGTNATLKIEVYEGAALKYTATRTVAFGA